MPDVKSVSSLFVDMTDPNLQHEAPSIDVPVVAGDISLGWIRMAQTTPPPPSSWPDLDASVKCLFDLHMARIDPFERLGLTGQGSLECYAFMGRVRHFEESEVREQQSAASDEMEYHTIHVSCKATK